MPFYSRVQKGRLYIYIYFNVLRRLSYESKMIQVIHLPTFRPPDDDATLLHCRSGEGFLSYFVHKKNCVVRMIPFWFFLWSSWSLRVTLKYKIIFYKLLYFVIISVYIINKHAYVYYLSSHKFAHVRHSNAPTKKYKPLSFLPIDQMQELHRKRSVLACYR